MLCFLNTIKKTKIIRIKYNYKGYISNSDHVNIKGDIDLAWLSLDKAKMSGTFISIPERDDMKLTVNEQLVVELYSK